MRITRLAILFSGYFLLLSCSPKNLIHIGQIKNIQLKGLEGKAFLCQAELEIENKYFLPFHLVAGELKVFASDQVIGNIQIKDTIHIKAREKKTYTINFNVMLNNDDLGFISFVQKFMNSSNSVISIKGNIHAHSLFINRCILIDIPINNW